MKTIEQNTNEWLELRKTRLGASDANIIMGKSKFKTPNELYLEKINPSVKKSESENTFVQDKGHRLEVKARAMIEIDTGLDFPPLVVLSENYPFLMASLDGYNAEKRIVLEAKYCGQDDFEKVKSGQILEHYKPQIMQQLLVTGADYSILAVCTENKDSEDKKELKYASVEIKPDLEYMKNELLPAMEKFWNCVQSKVPPALGNDDVLNISDEKISDMLHRYKLLVEDQCEMDKRVEDLKSEIFKASLKYHNKVICDGITVSENQNKDSVKTDYELFVEEQGLIIPDKYVSSKKGAKVRKITFPKS
jgi:putative phage-type endonuclease